ncbi:lipid-A-disaccharide synthase [Parabacteroides sp. PFB2-10]|uniref:lipid-A-disaccharide synthase n=1 Tax=Parabacteroides sp. PFB2-10 TaxID=1742405 RepID=UPI002475B98A|nr:lipid-A-disaccharide synthase [Parabacteroides sp. PFB2-10]MDH6313437.1 lipid-A-disaccharide synthase [Parabacteroides sp. PFB2-10]MDL2244127.1 lipid-A-disaccharide synthase [Parabacteroides sp. OttesenSCG-928-J18]
MKYYLIAGEASGDIHAANLMAALKDNDSEAEFRFFGGDRMQAVGGTLVKHYREMAYMGFIPVLLHARTILNNMKMCREDIAAYRPDVVILIDYPGFNLKIAKYVKKKLNIPVYYYISPKIWAWKKYRIKDIRRYIDRMFCILPFETEFYQSLNYAIDYVGNPSVDEIARYIENESIGKEEFLQKEQLSDKKIIALLAGSRKQEIKDNLPTMLKVAANYPDHQVLIAGAPGISPDYYLQYTRSYPNVKILFNQTYTLLQHSCATLVTSGTATLETALFLVPQVVCYYTPVGHLVSFVFHRFFGVDYISLVNLIAGKTVVKELFGKGFKLERIRQELDRLINDTDYRNQMIFDYEEVVRALGAPGASQRAAKLIVESLEKN